MNCTNCGAAVIGNSKNCGACGAKIIANAFAPTSRKCSRCGAVLNPGMKFCVGCGNVTGELPSSPTQPTRQAHYDSQFPSQFSTQPPSHFFDPAPGTAPARPRPANEAARQIKEESSTGQKIGLSAALFGVICFFLPWVEVSCMGMRKTASGLQLATDIDLPEVWLILLAMFAAVGLALFQIFGRMEGNPLNRLLSLASIGTGILPLAICLFEWIRFSNEISKMSKSDPYGFGRLMGSAIENSVSYEFGGILTVVCSLGMVIGGFLHLKNSRRLTSGP